MYNSGSLDVRRFHEIILRRTTPSHHAPSSQSSAVGYVTVSNSTFRHNLADVSSGAVAMLIGVYTSSTSVFSGNAATSVRGGCGLVHFAARLTVLQSRRDRKSFWVPSSVARYPPPIRRSWWCVLIHFVAHHLFCLFNNASQSLGDNTQTSCAALYGCVGCVPAPPSPPPIPPLPPPPDFIPCPLVTNRWPLNSAFADGSVVIDSVGSWNGTAHGQYAYTSDRGGAVMLSPGSVHTSFSPTSGVPYALGAGYIDIGTRTFGGPMSWLFWANQLVPQQNSRVFDWASVDTTHGLLFAPGGARQRGYIIVLPATNAVLPNSPLYTQ